MVEYKYDAWGNHEAEVAAEGYVALAEINPFRYRGYYYDTETGLYYLNTRYYDPEVGRFISRDSIEYATPETINGLNLYAYCGDNPVMNIDPNGNFVLSLTALILIGFGVSAAISAGASIISQGIDLGWNNINWWQVGLDGLIGGISGAFAMSGLGAIALGGIGAGLGFVGGLGGALLNGDDLGAWQTWVSIGFTTLIGGVAGLIGGAGARNATALNKAAFNKPSEAFLKACASYDKVLTKIATGAYKNLAGAAGAKHLTRMALVKAWDTMVYGHITSALTKALIKSGAITLGGTIGIAFLPL